MSVGLRRSLKYSLHWSTKSFVEVSSTPFSLYTVLTVNCFLTLTTPRRMVVQNLFEAVRNSFSMASPNSSHARVFASVTAITPLGLPVPGCCFSSHIGQKDSTGLLLQLDSIRYCRCPPAGVGVVATTGTDHLAATALVSRLDNGSTQHSPIGLNVPRFPRNVD